MNERAKRTGAALLTLSLQFADASPRAVLPRHRVAKWISAALDGQAQIAVRVVGRAEGRALNRAYRGEDHATNVLTFGYERRPVTLADLVLCAPVVAREARELGIALEAHYAHLLVHGTLHALGFDHRRQADAKTMQAREAEVLRRLGYADPYAR